MSGQRVTMLLCQRVKTGGVVEDDYVHAGQRLTHPTIGQQHASRPCKLAKMGRQCPGACIRLHGWWRKSWMSPYAFEEVAWNCPLKMSPVELEPHAYLTVQLASKRAKWCDKAWSAGGHTYRLPKQ